MANQNGKSSQQIYQEVTDRIVASLKQGVIPWERPWQSRHGGIHRNLTNKKRPYRGVNQFLLDLTALSAGYEQPWWVTYKQAKALGGQVRKGEKSTLVIFWKILKQDENGRPVKDGDDPSKVKRHIPLLRYYRVFNVEQCDGLEEKIPEREEPVEGENDPIDRAHDIINQMQNAPTITHGGDRAFYRHATDTVNLPKRDTFRSSEAYYCTAYHELVHSTGHEERTGRVKDWASFGTDDYAKEELVAEMGSAMLAAFAEIETNQERKNTEAYIKSWIKRFQDDEKLAVAAASKAQQAADYILEDS